MFNDYVWQLYLKSGGKEIADTFEKYLSYEGFSEEYADFVVGLHKTYCPSETIHEYIEDELLDAFNDALEIEILPEGEYKILTAMEGLYEFIKGDEELSDQQVFKYFSSSVTYYSTLLSLMLPDLFVPYYFKYNFNVFKKIADEFGIELMEMPLKQDYEGRFYYYAAICVALYDFREKHNMSPCELCAFLYDFAPKYIGGIDSYIIKDLPLPKGAYFIGGSEKDIFYNGQSDTIACWQCNPETCAGDMIVMYLRSPISAVDSVWRSVSPGFNDPFFYYYRCTYMSNPIAIKRVTQKQLEKDSVFKDMPLVRKNMQGVNGVELRPSQYNHLMDLAKADALRLQQFEFSHDAEYTCEKDVVDKIKDFLKSCLGYKDTDWVPELHIGIGNHNTMLIPDIVLLPEMQRGQYSAFAIIEAKFCVRNEKELEEYRIQMASYARQLIARYAVLASKDRLWLYSQDDKFTTPIFEAAWDELTDVDKGAELRKLIGRK